VYAFFARKHDMLELVRSIFLYRRYYESLAQSVRPALLTSSSTLNHLWNPVTLSSF
jgi:Ni,Fe-hydrogenase I cytochrome b subunit